MPTGSKLGEIVNVEYNRTQKLELPRYVADHRGQLEPKLYAVPQEIDREVAMRKLTALGVSIDRLTTEQEAYLASWNV